MNVIDFKHNSFLTAILNNHHIREIAVDIKGINGSISLRMDGSDQAVFNQVFVRRDYLHDLPAQAKYILDAGANIGLASLWFKRRYPSAVIVAVEPDPKNYEYLVTNTKNYDDIICLQGALWHERAELNLLANDDNGQDLGDWGRKVKSNPSKSDDVLPTCRAWSVDQILDMLELPHFDIAKIDIEGSEYEVFKYGNCNWIKDTALVIAETHERFKPGSHQAVEKAMEGRRCSRKGENYFYFNY